MSYSVIWYLEATNEVQEVATAATEASARKLFDFHAASIGSDPNYVCGGYDQSHLELSLNGVVIHWSAL